MYAQSALGMLGSEMALEELMCHVFGNLLEKLLMTYTVEGTPQRIFKTGRKSHKPFINVISVSLL